MNPNVAAMDPAKGLETLSEGREVDLPDFIVIGEPHEHADAPHPIALLRSCGERPHRSHATQKRDELATFHHVEFPSLLGEYNSLGLKISILARGCADRAR